MRRVDAGVTGPIGDTLAFRLDGVYVRRDGFYDDVNNGDATSTTATASSCAASCCSSRTTTLSVRLIGDYSKRDENCCGAVYRRRTTIDSTTVGGAAAIRRPRQQHHRRAARPRAGPRSRSTILTAATSRSRPGRTYRRQDQATGASRSRSTGTSAARADLDHRLSRLQGDAGRRHRLSARSTSCTATTTAAASAASRPSPRNCGSRARPSTTSSTGWSAAISPTRDLTRHATISASAPNMAASPPAALVTGGAARRRSTQPDRRRGCLMRRAARRDALGGVRRRPARSFLARVIDRLDGDQRPRQHAATIYRQNSRNFALFTHNIFHITDQLDLTVGLRYTTSARSSTPTFGNDNTACVAATRRRWRRS